MVNNRSTVAPAAASALPSQDRSGQRRQAGSSTRATPASFASFMQEIPKPVGTKARPIQQETLGYSSTGATPGSGFSFSAHEVLPQTAPVAQPVGKAVTSRRSGGKESYMSNGRQVMSALQARNAEAAAQQSFAPGMGTQSNRKTRVSTVRNYSFGMEDTRKTGNRIGAQTNNASSLRGAQSTSPSSMGGQGDYGYLEQTVLGKIQASAGQTSSGTGVSFSFNQNVHRTSTPDPALFSKVLENSSTPIRTINSGRDVVIGNPSIRQLYTPEGDEGARMAVQTASHRKKNLDGKASGNLFSFSRQDDSNLGALAARFESGSDGIAAVGYDRNGGTSYGKYQISSRAGTMNSFISYLKDEAPDLAKRLGSAGPANTGSKYGAMPNMWKKIAQEEPERFEKLQHSFIKTSHFEPAEQSIAEETGVSFGALPPALQEVLFSTAVQHGPSGATRIIGRAVNKVDASPLQNPVQATADAIYRAGKELIQEIYSIRSGQFGSSTQHIQASAKNRLTQEMQEALAMFRG